jgi:hypothetical protein
MACGLCFAPVLAVAIGVWCLARLTALKVFVYSVAGFGITLLVGVVVSVSLRLIAEFGLGIVVLLLALWSAACIEVRVRGLEKHWPIVWGMLGLIACYYSMIVGIYAMSGI